MTQAHSFARAPLHRVLLCALAAVAACVATAAQASGDGLAISGAPPSSISVGQTLSFTPTVSDPSKRGLEFGITGLPKWATFDSANGRISGTPTAADVGTYSDIFIAVTDWVTYITSPEYSIKVTAAAATTDKPVISGTPATSVVVGNTYKFQPTAKDPDGKTLSFSVANKPDWASFSISSGLLDGTPTSSETGSYGDIIITASNGTASSSLPAFSVAVSKTTTPTPPPSTGSATVDWIPPTKNTNGTPLTDLAGVRIYYGSSKTALNSMVQVASSTETSTTITNLSAGPWYFSAAAYTTTGVQGAMSSVVSATVP